MSSVEDRIRRALEGSKEDSPRPMASLELPLAADKWLRRRFLKNLRPAAVLVPILRSGDDYKLVLTRRAEHLSSHKGQISFPGGGRDAEDRSAVDNALRESWEEVGLETNSVEVLGFLDDYPTISKYMVTPVVGVFDGPFEAVADPSEVAEVFQVPMELLLDPSAYRKKKISRDGLIVPYYEVNWRQYRIWGATAGMLWDLCCKVNALER